MEILWADCKIGTDGIIPGAENAELWAVVDYFVGLANEIWKTQNKEYFFWIKWDGFDYSIDFC